MIWENIFFFSFPLIISSGNSDATILKLVTSVYAKRTGYKFRNNWAHALGRELQIKMAATTKRKRVSKKSKQSWRKHTDIKDVEEYLEEERREERTGWV